MHLPPLIRDLGVMLAVAGAVTFLFQRIKQPVVLGYIITGFIVGPHTPPFTLITDMPNIRTWAELGVIFLMFSLGLEFSFRRLAKVGASAGVTALFEVVFMIALGYGCGRFFGWANTDSIFLGAMLSISSTTIIIKALDELGLKSRRFAQMIFGVLIVEDLVAILVLVMLSSIAVSQAFSLSTLGLSAGKLLLVVASWFIAGYFLVPRVIKRVGRTGPDELLITLSLGLCLLMVVLASEMDYSVALGAFIAGSILAESTESHRIEELVKPLRDLFAAIFFVSVGMLMDPRAIWQHKWPILAISLVTIAGKILSTSLGALVTGQTLRTSVQIGFGLAQIGEFSFIIAGLGQSFQVTSDFLYPVGVAVSLVTTFTTPYLIRVSNRAARAIESRLPDSTLDFLSEYAAWSEARRTSMENVPELQKEFLRWLLNGLIVSAIWVGVARFFVPLLARHLENELILQAGGWLLAIFASAPFVWAMVARAPRVAILTLIWLGLLSLAFFPARYVGVVVSAVAALFFWRFYHRLEKSYHWFERQFLQTFEAGKKSKHPSDDLKRLAPWDAHLVRLKVHPDSALAGKRIMDTELRKKFGLNIVAIHRGSKTIVSPSPVTQLFPDDELLVLGTDDQVEAARPRIEKAPGIAERRLDVSDYELKRLFVGEESHLLGRSIRESQIRETHGAMVVGIERRGRRIMNPETDTVIEIEDVLLLVGRADQVEDLLRRAG